MPELSSIVLWLAAGLTVTVALFVVGGLTLRIVRGRLRERMERRLARVEEILARHGRDRYANVDRLLFELGQVDDREAVERALAEVLHEEGAELRPRLRAVYDTLGLTAAYRGELRDAPSWSRRAAAAKALGLLVAVEAIPQLLEAMRDPDEDETVKQAAGRALSQMQADEAIPTLVDALASADDWASPRLAELLVAFGERALDPLLAALDDEEHVNARVWSAQILGRMAERKALAALLPRLKDRSERVRLSVTEALGRIADRSAVAPLTRLALRDPVPTVRAEAARALGSIGDDSVLGELQLLLAADDYWTRLRAVEAIEKLAPDDTFALEQALDDASRVVRSEAARALERLGVLERWIEELASTEGEIADLAERRLVAFATAGSVESLLPCADDERLTLRARICRVLGEVGDPLGGESVARLLEDPLWPVRVRAIEAVGRLSIEDAAERIVARLGDEEEMVRVAAVGALRGIGTTQLAAALDALAELYRHGNAEARCSVIESIGELPLDETRRLVDQALGDPNAEVRLHALRLVERRDPERWTERLIERMGDPETAVRTAAARALSAAPTPEAIEAMIDALTTADPELRAIATDVLAREAPARVLQLGRRAGGTLEHELALAQALGKCGDDAAVTALSRFADDDRPRLRAEAATAYGRAGRWCRPLAALIGDPNEQVRIAAVDAAGRMDGLPDLDPLIDALHDPSSTVRARAAIALGRRGGDRAAACLEAIDSEDGELAATIGLALIGRESGRRRVLAALGDRSMRRRIEALIAREDPELRERFRAALLLDDATDEDELAPETLAARYEHRLRNAREEANRLDALQALRALAPPSMAGRLMEALAADPAAALRREAVAALAPLMRDEQVTAAVRRALADPDPGVQRAAVEALASACDPAHNDALLRCGAMNSPLVADAIVPALAAANRRRVADFTDELMGHATLRVQVLAARVLGEIGDAAGQRLLARFAASAELELRAAAIVALGKIGSMEALTTIAEAAGDPREEVRIAVVDALVELPLKSGDESLGLLLRDPSVAVRERIAERLALSRDAEAIELLDRLAGDPAERVRELALWSLLTLADPAALDRYAARIERQTEAVRAALRARARAHGAPAKLAREAREHRDGAVRALALALLDALGEALDPIALDALTDPDGEVRLLAIEIVARREGAACLERLESLLDDPEPRVRDAARRARLKVVPSAGG